MIWIVATILSVACFVFLFWPSKQDQQDRLAEIKIYDEAISDLEQKIKRSPEDEGLNAKLTHLQRQLLATQSGETEEQLSTKFRTLLIGFLAMAALGFYAIVGDPVFSPTQATQTTATDQEQVSLPELANRLETRLQQDPTNSTGWLLYARALMTLRRYDDAIGAYDKAIQHDPSNDNLSAERLKAVEFIEAQSAGPSAEQIQAAEAMSEEDRQAMIENMVSGLAARLYQNPEDPEGWKRLIRARKVLGQTETLEQELILMRETYSDRPEILNEILNTNE